MSTTVSDPHNLPGPVLILIRGLPGSGKSHLANALAKRLGKDRVVMLDPDDIDQKSQEYLDMSASLTAEGVEAIYHPNRFLKAKGREAISARKFVIWTQAFTHLEGFKRSADNLKVYASEQGIPLPLLLIEVEISHEIAKERAAKREAETGRSVPEEAFARFINDYRSFSEEGVETVTVSGDNDVSVSVDTVLETLHRLAKQ
jgi:thymidylate kinase